jgi:eukaryotic-like serine/threonine-protein kinase
MNDMPADQWKRLRDLLDRALDLEDAARAAFVDALEGDDRVLRPELAKLLAKRAMLAGAPMASAMELVAPVFAEDETLVDTSRVGQNIGRYELLHLLGAGGMGAVYLARWTSEGFTQQVALKLVRHVLMSAEARDRFNRERQILATLKHHGIALLFDGGQTAEGQAYYTMEYVDGEAITDYCIIRRLDTKERVALLLQVANALAYAHQNLIVHRDIKPSNVLVTREGRTKLVDFGLAKALDQHADAAATQAEIRPMTPAYAAPEQFRHEKITTATDVYQFGVLCFVVLAGRLPYRGDPHDPVAWSRAVTEQEPMRLSHAAQLRAIETGQKSGVRGRRLTSDIDAIVRKALAKDPRERYRSIDAMIADLEAFIDGRAIRARRAGPLYFVWRFAQRWRYVVVPVALILVGWFTMYVIAQRSIGFWVRRWEMSAYVARDTRGKADFLIGLLQAGDAEGHGNGTRSVGEILESASKRIDEEAAAKPIEAAHMHSWLGEVYLTLGDLPHARPAIESAVGTLRSAGNKEGYALAHALRLLAQVTNRTGEPEKALGLLAEAETHLTGEITAVRLEHAELRANRGAVLACLGRDGQAQSELEAARSSLRDMQAPSGAIDDVERRLQHLADGKRDPCVGAS